MADENVTVRKPSQRSLRQWLFNPFQYVAGIGALVTGMAVIVVIALLGWTTNTHFDGVLDIHIGTKSPVWFFVAEGFIDWFSLSLALVLSGIAVTRSRFRIIDLLGTQALARYPGVIVVAVLLIEPLKNAVNRVAAHILDTAGQPDVSTNPAVVDMLFFGVVMFVTLLVIIWTVVLMYRAYSISCDIKGPKAIGSFVISLIAAEVVSKVLLWQMALHMSH